MFSMAGIPPLAGFFGKLYVFLAAVQGGFWVLATIGVLTSVVSAYYYLRIVKAMYFDQGAAGALDRAPASLSVVMAGAGLFNMFFILWPTPMLGAAEGAIGGTAHLSGGVRSPTGWRRVLPSTQTTSVAGRPRARGAPDGLAIMAMRQTAGRGQGRAGAGRRPRQSRHHHRVPPGRPDRRGAAMGRCAVASLAELRAIADTANWSLCAQRPMI